MNKRFFSIIVSVLLLISFTNLSKAKAYSSRSYNASVKRNVMLLKPRNVYKVKLGASESKNKFTKVGKLDAGSIIKVSNYYMSTGGGYVIKTKKYTPNNSSFYWIYGSNVKPPFSSWNKQDEKRLKKYNKEAKEKIKKQEKREDKESDKDFKNSWNNSLKNWAKKNPILISNVKTTSDQNALDNISFSYEKSGKHIYADCAPTDSKAYIADNITVDDGTDWEDTENDTSYVYIGNNSKINPFYQTTGWAKSQN